jgi:ABC-2 type transport system ATP-binding protein
MWAEIERLAEQESLTILLTTHYLEEADRLAGRVAIVSRGKVVVEGTPEELKAGLRGESVSVELQEANGGLADAAAVVRQAVAATEVHVEGQLVRVRVPNGAHAIPVILSTLDDRGFAVASVTTARPSLDDVYLHYTGRDFASEDEAGR